MFKAPAVIELRFFSKDIWSDKLFLSGSWDIFHPTEVQLHKFSLQKIPFHHGTILMQNINKIPKKIENANDHGND